ncbi:MAG: sigma-54-dependent Fis family transcriptional regulator [Acidobacteria bacterium]|nr:sigma-54-dependent Fis family transcriptional regulator [Acidobacteriota bacterium]
MPLVFVVDDDPVTCEAIFAVLAPEGHDVRTFTRPKDALEAAHDEPPAVAVTDFSMPEMNGLEFVGALRRVAPDTTFLVVSGQATVEDAVALMKHGVVDVMVKPPRAQGLRKALALAISQHELSAENRRLRQALRGRRQLKGVIGSSPAFEAALRLIEKAAPTQTTVLVTGETGTGKEVIADALHELSPRAERALVKVHCAAIPTSLLESELFGHVRGAFTGAIRDKRGYFEEAHQGTIFLDEVGEMGPELQTKLLRVLQTGEVQRVGDAHTRTVDVRVVAATHRDLEVEVAEGRFREDLFYRLNVIPIRVPPLRSRGDDVLLLANFFLERYSREHGRRDLVEFSPEASARMLAYRWPGNVRELENVVQRVVALADGPRVLESDLPDALRGEGKKHEGSITLASGTTLDEAERLLIEDALERAGGNKRDAAHRLGIGLATLYRKLASYQSTSPERPEES